MTTAPLSVQLYTVREAMAEDLPGTLQRIADIGFRQVEPYGFGDRAAEYTAALAAAGLTAPSTHASLLNGGLDELFAAAKNAGIGTVIDPHIDEARWTTRDDIAGIAAQLGEISKQAADSGIRIGYHNHAFELSTKIDGTSALEVFEGLLDPAIVLEVDTYWAEVGGVPAAALLERLGDRVQFLHIKDGDKSPDTKKQVALGSGSIAIAEILAAAPQALPVVELDDFAGEMWDAVTDSYAFMTKEVVR